MGIFNKLGREFEEFKQNAKEAAATEFRCEECDATFHADYDECPECGAEAVTDTEG